MSPRPHVLVNMAMTADGKIDTVERAGARISGATDTLRVDQLRADMDAVMVGGRTLLREDPRLTVRDPALSLRRQRSGRAAQPTKVAVVSRVGQPGHAGSLPRRSRFLHEGAGQVVVFTSERTDATTVAWLEREGARVLVLGGQRVDLPAALSALQALGVERLMVEGGSTLVAALLEARLVDDLQLAIAPLLFGGEAAPTPVGGRGWSRGDAIPLALIATDTGPDGDVVLHYRVTAAPAHV